MKSLFPFNSGSGISDEDGLGDIVASGSEASNEGGGTNSGSGSGSTSSGSEITDEDKDGVGDMVASGSEASNEGGGTNSGSGSGSTSSGSEITDEDKDGVGDMVASGSEASNEGGGANSGSGSASASASGSGEKIMEEEGKEEKEECADALITDEGDDIIHSTAYTATTCSLLCMEYMVNNSEYEVTNSYIVYANIVSLS